MVGSAVATMVWSSAARSIPSSSAPMITSSRRWSIAAVPGAAWVLVTTMILRLARTAQVTRHV